MSTPAWLRAARPWFGEVSRVSLGGTAVIATGVIADLAAHVAAGAAHGQAGFSPSEHAAHFIVLAGMVLTLAGVAIDGARRQLGRTNPKHIQDPQGSQERTTHHAAR